MDDQPSARDWVGPEDVSEDKMRELKRDLRALVETAGWKYLAKAMEARYHALMAGIARYPLPSLDGALEQEYLKGQAMMALENSQLADVLIQYWEAQLEYSQPLELKENWADE